MIIGLIGKIKEKQISIYLLFKSFFINWTILLQNNTCVPLGNKYKLHDN